MAHSGPTAKGSFVQTLTLTDIATGWTECAPLLVREQKLLTEVLSAMREWMPFALLGFDTDNDSVFMNETVKTYCEEAGLVFTRCRPIARTTRPGSSRRTAPWSGVLLVTGATRAWTRRRRWRGVPIVAASANFFQPSFKLAAKARDGAQIRKKYHPPATPFQRLLATPGSARTGGAGSTRFTRPWTLDRC